jgi:peptide/nickel transport system permease protein
MIQFILKRLALAIPLALGASFITFTILYFVPGDPVVTMLGDKANDAALVEKMREQLGLNDPFLVRYGRFLKGLATGDLGTSFVTNRPIVSELATALPATIELALAGLLLATVIGVGSGIISAVKQYTGWDYGFMVLALLGVSIPVFWLALLLSYFFAFKWPWFDMAGRISQQYSDFVPVTHLLVLDSILTLDWVVLKDVMRHLFLPALTLGLIGSALIARMTRSSVLEIKNRDFVRTARAKGLGAGRVLWHVLRNAMLPVVTVVGLQFGSLLGGAIITEEIFAWPGLGTYLVQAIRYRDIVAVQGAVMLIVVMFLLVNLLVDLTYALIDPRVEG